MKNEIIVDALFKQMTRFYDDYIMQNTFKSFNKSLSRKFSMITIYYYKSVRMPALIELSIYTFFKC